GAELGALVVGDRAQLARLALGPPPQALGLALGRRPGLVGLAVGGVPAGLGLALRRGLHGCGDGPCLFDHLLGLEVGGGDQLLGLALGLVAVLVGLFLGQPQQLLDPRAEPGKRGLGGLVQLLGLLGDFTLELVDAISRVRRARLGLGGRSGQLFDAGLEPLDEHVDLCAFVTPEADGEVRGAGAIGRRRSGSPHEDSSWHAWQGLVASDGPGPATRTETCSTLGRRRSTEDRPWRTGTPSPSPSAGSASAIRRTFRSASRSPSTTSAGTSWAGATTRASPTCTTPSARTSVRTSGTAGASTAASWSARSTAGATTPTAPTPRSPTAIG